MSFVSLNNVLKSLPVNADIEYLCRYLELVVPYMPNRSRRKTNNTPYNETIINEIIVLLRQFNVRDTYYSLRNKCNEATDSFMGITRIVRAYTANKDYDSILTSLLMHLHIIEVMLDNRDIVRRSVIPQEKLDLHLNNYLRCWSPIYATKLTVAVPTEFVAGARLEEYPQLLDHFKDYVCDDVLDELLAPAMNNADRLNILKLSVI